jgi:prepilin-type N-terminal cleavage/methylation domain-containing protein
MMQPQVFSSSTRRVPQRMPAGFTITELLIVIAIIVLVLALAVPAFNAITGNKSEAAMFNTISAMLARARTEAVGVQQLRGIMFYYDPNNGSTKVALVRQVDPPYNPAAVTPVPPLDNIDVYLDLTSDSDVLTLPAGIGVQTIGEYSQTNSDPVRFDGYIGYNNFNAHNSTTAAVNTYVRYGGVILFDGRGQLVRKSYAFLTHRINLSAGTDIYTPMGLLLYGDTIQPTDLPNPEHDDLVPVDPTKTDPNGERGLYFRSQIGLAVFPFEPFAGINGNFDKLMGDSQVRSPGSLDADEIAEEGWLNSNATIALINRYNGELLKGELE